MVNGPKGSLEVLNESDIWENFREAFPRRETVKKSSTITILLVKI